MKLLPKIDASGAFTIKQGELAVTRMAQAGVKTAQDGRLVLRNKHE